MGHSEEFLRLEALPGRGGAETGDVPLPSGWSCLRDCNIGGRLDRPVQVDYVLLHPDVGIALLNIGQADAADAADVLRARLRAACFEGIFPGYLPVAHLVVAPGDLPALGGALEDAFAALSPLSLPGGDAWISVVRRALSPQDPARGAAPLLGASSARPERLASRTDAAGPSRVRIAVRPIPGRIMPARSADPLPPDETDSGAAAPPVEFPLPELRRRRPWAWAAAALGGFATLALGLAALLPSGPRPASHPAPVDPPAVTATARDPQPAASVPPASPGPDGTTAAGAPSPTPPAEASATSTPPPTVVVRVRANLRAGPSLSANVLRTIQPGQEFGIHGRAPGGWVRVGDAEPLGWMHSSVLNGVQP